MKQKGVTSAYSQASLKKKTKKKAAVMNQYQTMQQSSSAQQLSTERMNKKSTYMGNIRYAEINSNSTAPMTGNFLSETECKSIEEAVAKEVLGEVVYRGNKTTGQREQEQSQVMNKSMHSRKGSSSQLRLMTFKELRELQKVASTSHVGPGSYEPSKLQMQKITFGQRREDNLEKTPGPGEYELDSGMVATKYSSLSYQMRGKSKELRLNNTLGPGEYDNHVNQFGQEAIKWTMGGKNYDTVDNKTPAVGTYDTTRSVQLTKPRSQAYTLNARKPDISVERAKRDISPGPCYYNTSREIGADTVSVSISGRPSWKPANNNPGPCDYNNRHDPSRPRTPGFEMSKSKSRNYHKRDHTPSVGQYEPHKTFGSDITGGTIGTKQQWKPRDNNPAPGQYNPNKEVVMFNNRSTVDISKSPNQPRLKFAQKATHNISSVSYDYLKPFGSDATFKTIQGRPKFKPMNNNPGPTSYNPKLHGIMPNQNNLLTSKSQRTLKILNKNPDAGMYQKIDQFGKNAPKYTMMGRADKDKRNRNPSPLQYDPSYKLVKPTTPGAFIKRDQMVLVDVSKYL